VKPLVYCWRTSWLALCLLLLTSCASPDRRPAVPVADRLPAVVAGNVVPPETDTAVVRRGNSRWVLVDWDDVPGWHADALHEAWGAFVRSCERPASAFVALCPEVRRLSIADESSQRAWLQQRLQPYRVEPLDGAAGAGLLTAYFEPELAARRLPGAGFEVPLYQPPAGLVPGKPWFSRREIDSLAQAQAALRGREIVYVSDAVQALVVQIQGSARLRVTEPDGSQRLLRLAYAGHNGHTYQSIGRWLLDQGELRDASWPAIAAWLAQNPQRVGEVLSKNPRVVFFREQALSDLDASFGPVGAQGVALTPGRSIAVDPQSIPYGAPVWLASTGPTLPLERLVLAQDTGNAITGAVRADYFVGWGSAAGELAGRVKQPLRLWVLWPKGPG